MKNIWLIAAGLGVAGTAAYLISRNLGNKEEDITVAKGKIHHITDAFSRAKDYSSFNK